MSHQAVALQYDQALIEATAYNVDKTLIDAHTAIRRYRWIEAEALYHLQRKPDPESDYLFRYADSACETWSQFCEDRRRPSRMTAYKLIQLYQFYILKHGYTPNQLLDCGIDSLYDLTKRLRDQRKNAVIEALAYHMTMGRDDWRAWIESRYPLAPTKIGQIQVNPHEVVFVDTAVDIQRTGSIAIPRELKLPDSVVRVTLQSVDDYTPVTATHNDLLNTLDLCKRLLEGHLQGEGMDTDTVKLAVNQIKIIQQLEVSHETTVSSDHADTG